MVNAPVLRKELEYITAHRDEWNQEIWLSEHRDSYLEPTTCGTTGCLAGNTVLHAGLIHGVTRVYWSEAAQQYVAGVTLYTPCDPERVAPDEAASWSETAAGILGLTRSQANQLFASGNSLHNLWELAYCFTADSDDVIEVPLEVSA